MHNQKRGSATISLTRGMCLVSFMAKKTATNKPASHEQHNSIIS